MERISPYNLTYSYSCQHVHQRVAVTHLANWQNQDNKIENEVGCRKGLIPRHQVGARSAFLDGILRLPDESETCLADEEFTEEESYRPANEKGNNDQGRDIEDS